MEKIRIQKIIADSGFCSRRKAEEFILANRVKVNGHPAVIGQKLNPMKDIVVVDGKQIVYEKKQKHYYLMMNKPRGYLTAMSDERGRRCVPELLPPDLAVRVYPVGRLDLNSEGLLLFTNDGDFANDLMHPSRQVTKTYRVTVRPDVTDEQAAKLSAGVYLDGRLTAPANVLIKTKQPGRVVMEISIHEGRNRQIRRMCEEVGLEVARLKRVAMGPIRLGMLKPGTVRELTAEELKALRMAISKA